MRDEYAGVLDGCLGVLSSISKTACKLLRPQQRSLLQMPTSSSSILRRHKSTRTNISFNIRTRSALKRCTINNSKRHPLKASQNNHRTHKGNHQKDQIPLHQQPHVQKPVHISRERLPRSHVRRTKANPNEAQGLKKILTNH